MKRLTIVIAFVAGALALAAAGLADPGTHGKKGKAGHAKFTFAMTTTDNGSCGTAWANDTETRTYSVKDNGDGTFTVRRSEKGTFTTIGSPSPGSCETTGKHGATVAAAVTGKFKGYLVGTVTATSFNPNATCAPGADCSSRTGFIATYFAPGATYSCDQGADCKFNFNYTASAKPDAQKKLLFRHWQDKGKGAGTLLKEEFHGDIATS
jgi:hypothetical protein